MVLVTTRKLLAAKRIIKVIGKGNKERFVPLGEIASYEMKIYINDRNRLKIDSKSSDILFLNRYGRRLTRSMIFKIISDASKRIGLDKKISPHTLRHSFATHLINEGADINSVKELLGHSSLSATQVYSHTSMERIKEVFKNSHPRAK